MSAGVWGLPPIQLSAKRALLCGRAEARAAAWAGLGGSGGSRGRGGAYRGDGRAGEGGVVGSWPGGAAAETAESAGGADLGRGPERSGGAGPGGGEEGRTGGLSRRAGGAGGEALGSLRGSLKPENLLEPGRTSGRVGQQNQLGQWGRNWNCRRSAGGRGWAAGAGGKPCPRCPDGRHSRGRDGSQADQREAARRAEAKRSGGQPGPKGPPKRRKTIAAQ